MEMEMEVASELVGVAEMSVLTGRLVDARRLRRALRWWPRMELRLRPGRSMQH